VTDPANPANPANPAILGVQARRDRELRGALAEDRGVKKALEKFEQRASGYGFRARRGLLADAIRLNRRMAPQVADALADCRARLGVERPVEIFLRPDPHYGASCYKGRSGPLVIALSSRLVEDFTPAELRFVLGHELGHAAYDHFGIPMPITATIEDIGGTLVSRATQLRLFVWCRAAEVSADRAGLVCAGDPEAGALAFFKMASGLSRPVITADLDAFAAQIESMASSPSATVGVHDDDDTLDCFATHPYTPVRVRALLAFGHSDAFHSITGQGGGGIGLDMVEQVVERDLALMEPSYLEDAGPSAERLRRGLYCAGVAVAAAHAGISPEELSALRALLGAKQAKAPEDVAQIKAELEELLGELAAQPLAHRAQLVQHLTVIAGVDGHVADEEYAEMSRIADRLGVPTQVIDQTLAGAAAPMD
jgi:Zn-dependent protease with chaperone function/uncharacterized tellurite resistance protein B-like protein